VSWCANLTLLVILLTISVLRVMSTSHLCGNRATGPHTPCTCFLEMVIDDPTVMGISAFDANETHYIKDNQCYYHFNTNLVDGCASGIFKEAAYRALLPSVASALSTACQGNIISKIWTTLLERQKTTRLKDSQISPSLLLKN